MPCVRRWEATTATSPNQDGVAACDSDEVWIWIDPSAILITYASLRGLFVLPIQRGIFLGLFATGGSLIAHVVGEGETVDWEKLFPSGFRPLPRAMGGG